MTTDDEADTNAPSTRRTAPWIAGAVGVVLLLFIVLLATRSPRSDQRVTSPLVGKSVPALSGTTLDGQPFDIDDHRGKFVVVNFFATWCIPCVQEHPELVAFTEAHRAADDVVVVSVAFDDTPARIEEFFRTYGGSWPVLVRDTGPTALDFGVSGVPESYVVSPSRQVVAKFIGVTQQGLDEVITEVRSKGGFG